MGGHGTFAPVPASNHPTVALVVDGAAVEVPDRGGTPARRPARRPRRPHGRRTAAAPRASAAAARCWSTASPGSRASRRCAGWPAGRSRRRRPCPTPTAWAAAPAAPPAGASAASARRGSPCRLSALAAGGAAGADDGGGGVRAGAARPPVPVHGVAPGPRRLAASPPARARSTRGPAATRPPPCERAALETGGPQDVSEAAALGAAAFAADSAPPGALVAVPDGEGGWAVASTLAEARPAAGTVQGRRSTFEAGPPLDAARRARGRGRCAPRGASPATSRPTPRGASPAASRRRPLANGGAFGGKRRLAAARGRPARWPTSTAGRCSCVWSREDTVRWGHKRPPLAAGVDAIGPGRGAGRPHARASPRRIRAVPRPRPRRRGGRRRRARRPRRGCGPPGGPRRRCSPPGSPARPRWPSTDPHTGGRADGARSSTARCACGSRRARCSTRWCSAPTAPARPTRRSAGYQRGARGDRRRAARPHHPQLRHPPCRRHAADRGRGGAGGGRRAAGAGRRRRVRRGGGGDVGRARLPAGPANEDRSSSRERAERSSQAGGPLHAGRRGRRVDRRVRPGRPGRGQARRRRVRRAVRAGARQPPGASWSPSARRSTTS